MVAEARRAQKEIGLAPRAGRDARLRRGDGAHAPDPRADQPRGLRRALPRRARRRGVPRRGALRGQDPVEVGDADAALQEGGDRDRRARGRAADRGPRGGRLPDERDDLQPDRAAAPLRRDRRRPDRLRAGAGLPPARLRGDVLHADAHVLPREDADAARSSRRRFAAGGHRLVASAKIQRVERAGGEKIVHFAPSAAAAPTAWRSTSCCSASGARPTSRASISRRSASATTRSAASMSTTTSRPRTRASTPLATSA